MRRRGDDRAILLEGAVDDEIGRNDPGGMFGSDPRGFIVEFGGERGAARQIGVGIGGIGDAVLVVEEIGDQPIDAAELGDRVRFGPAVQAIAKGVVGVDISLPWAAERVVIDAVHSGELGGVEALEFSQPLAIEILAAQDACWGAVGETRFRGGAVALVGAERGREFGIEVKQHVIDAII